jgi:hypothetical protein
VSSLSVLHKIGWQCIVQNTVGLAIYVHLQGCNKNGWWLPPMEMKVGLDFRIWEVARTTSAAPAFLPYKYSSGCGL